MIYLGNYLGRLDEAIYLFGVQDILKELHHKKKEEILPTIRKKVHITTYYCWLSGHSPIPLKYFNWLSKFDKNLGEKAFSKITQYSVSQKRCTLPKFFTPDLAYLIGALISVVLLAWGEKKLSDKLPFGTFLTLSGFLAMLWGEELLIWYLNLIGFR